MHFNLLLRGEALIRCLTLRSVDSSSLLRVIYCRLLAWILQRNAPSADAVCLFGILFFFVHLSVPSSLVYFIFIAIAFYSFPLTRLSSLKGRPITHVPIHTASQRSTAGMQRNLNAVNYHCVCTSIKRRHRSNTEKYSSLLDSKGSLQLHLNTISMYFNHRQHIS